MTIVNKPVDLETSVGGVTIIGGDTYVSDGKRFTKLIPETTSSGTTANVDLNSVTEGVIKTTTDNISALNVKNVNGQLVDNNNHRIPFNRVGCSVITNTNSVSIKDKIKTNFLVESIYNSDGNEQDIITNINSVDFTQPNNGSGYYHFRGENTGENSCIVKDDESSLITGDNSNFDIDIGNWSGSNGATLSVDSGRLKIAGDTTDNPTASFSISGLTTDKFYALELDFSHSTGDFTVSVGNINSRLLNGSRKVRIAFRVTVSDQTISITGDTTDNALCYIDNVKLFKETTTGKTNWETDKGVSEVEIKNLTTARNNNVYDGLRGNKRKLFTAQPWSEGEDGNVEFIENGIKVIPGNADVVNNGDTYSVRQTLYTHISWGRTSHNKFQLEAYNPITKQGIVFFNGSGVGQHRLHLNNTSKIDYSIVKNIDREINIFGVTDKYYFYPTIRSYFRDMQISNKYLNIDNVNEIIIRDNAMDRNNTNENHILRYKCVSDYWDIGEYSGTGHYDETVRLRNGSDKEILVNVNTEVVNQIGTRHLVQVDIGEDGKVVSAIFKSINVDGDWIKFTSVPEFQEKPYLLNASYKANDLDGDGVDDGDIRYIVGSYSNNSNIEYEYPIDSTTLVLDNSYLNFIDGVDEKGYISSSKKLKTELSFTGKPDGKYWVGLDTNDSIFLTKNKPSYELYSKEYVDDNRLVFIDGKWYETTGDNLINNNSNWTPGIDSGVDQKSFKNGDAELSIANGLITVIGGTDDYPLAYYNLELEPSEEYILELGVVHEEVTNGPYMRIAEYSDNTLTDQSYIKYTDFSLGDGVINTRTFKFVPNHVNNRLYFMLTTQDNETATFIIPKVYKTKPSINIEPIAPITFFKHPIVLASGTPQYIDYSDSIEENILLNTTYEKDFKEEYLICIGYDSNPNYTSYVEYKLKEASHKNNYFKHIYTFEYTGLFMVSYGLISDNDTDRLEVTVLLDDQLVNRCDSYGNHDAATGSFIYKVNAGQKLKIIKSGECHVGDNKANFLTIVRLY